MIERKAVKTKAGCNIGVLLIFQLYSSQGPDSDTLKAGSGRIALQRFRIQNPSFIIRLTKAFLTSHSYPSPHSNTFISSQETTH